MNNNKKKYRAIALIIIVVLFCPVLFFFIKPRISYDIIAIPAQSSPVATVSSRCECVVAPVFSRCAYFVIYNTKTKTCDYLPNKFKNDSHEIVPYLLKKKAGIVIVKQISPNDYENLSLYGVKIYVCTSAATVMDAIDDFRNGLLVRTDTPTGLVKIFYQK
jgi:predicted Fe-Mo cluster-binding NifX family protein